MFPAELLSDPGMLTVFIAVVVAEMLSLGFLWLASYEYRHLMQRHARFFDAIDDGGRYEHVRRRSRRIYVTYVLSTLVVTAATLAIFVFQPHVL